MTVMSSIDINDSMNPIMILLFLGIWTSGMAAMMFPAISPMVVLYNRLMISKGDRHSGITTAVLGQGDKRLATLFPARTMLFVGSYLLIWAVTGLALLLGWSSFMNVIFLATSSANPPSQDFNIIYGSIMIISGAYQFSPLKDKCLGYCESPMSFFMRRWKDGTSGAVKMGLYHGVYCLGCCWPYFLLMVSLGWMNLLWMGLFAAVIFGEKIWWKNGIWVARAAGVGLAIGGILMLITGYGSPMAKM